MYVYLRIIRNIIILILCITYDITYVSYVGTRAHRIYVPRPSLSTLSNLPSTLLRIDSKSIGAENP